MNSHRRLFLRTTGLAGAGSLLPFLPALAKTEKTPSTTACVLIPSETAGPFPLDLTANTEFFRQDIREGKTGTPLRVKMKITGIGNCLPMANVRVNIWHCDKDGLYSGYSQTNNPGQAGLKYLRGYQLTDENGVAEFLTIFPGWYPGRICHIHFQVFVSTAYSAVSQFTFDIATKQAIYAANSALYTKGSDPMSLSSDNIFADGYAYQMATLTEDTALGGYEANIEVGIQGNGITSTGHLEKEAARQFSLGQNYPNPYAGETTLPLTLHHPADVDIALYDLQGRKVHAVSLLDLPAGEHPIRLNMAGLGLSAGSYVYQATVTNALGRFTDVKRMTRL